MDKALIGFTNLVDNEKLKVLHLLPLLQKSVVNWKYIYVYRNIFIYILWI